MSIPTAAMNMNSMLPSNIYVLLDDFRYSPNRTIPQKVLTSGSAWCYHEKFKWSAHSDWIAGKHTQTPRFMIASMCMCLSICMLCLNSPELHQLLHILQLGLPWTGDRSRTHRGAQLKRPSLCHSSHWDKPLALIWVRPLQGGRGRWYLEWGQARNMRPKSRRMQCRQPNEELLLSECAIDRSLQG